MASEDVLRLLRDNLHPEKRVKIMEKMKATKALHEVSWPCKYYVVASRMTPCWMAFTPNLTGLMKEGMDDDEALALLAGLARLEKKQGKVLVVAAI